MKYSFCQRTHDVACDSDILAKMKADKLLRIRGVDILSYLSCDVAVLRRRSVLFADTVEIPGMLALLDSMVTNLNFISDMVKTQSSLMETERGLYSVKELQQYFAVIDPMETFYAQNKERFRSEDYRALFEQVHEIAASEEYQKLKKGTKKLLDEIAGVKSISVGFNFDPSLAPYEAGILSVNDHYIESGLLIDKILRLDTGSVNMSITPLTFTKKQCKDDEYNTLNYALYSALNKIFRRLIRQWEPEIDAYIQEHLQFLLDLLSDLQFLLSMAKIQISLVEHGMKLCKVQYHVTEEGVFTARGLYNPILALSLAEQGKKVVKNDVTFDENGKIYILTGPNNGGKSEFIVATCLMTVMAQLGMMVPADEFHLSPVDGIFLQFSQHHALHQKGRLAEECSLIGEMFSKVTPNAICFFDETFASTDAGEAVELSVEVLHALACIGSKCIYNTHFHQIAQYADPINRDANTKGKIDFLVAGIGAKEERTYQIHRTSPEGKSYAKSIAETYGITYEKLIARSDNT